MKKLIPLALVALFAFPLVAQEEAPAAEAKEQPAETKVETSVWPAFFAVAQWPRTADVVGLRLTIPFSTTQENVTGVDVGFWGQSLYFEGVQANILRNDAADSFSGVQVGLYNSVGCGEMVGVQAGLWNEALTFCGVQAGLVNVVGDGEGFQVGLINRAETLHGYQVGLINVIRDAEVRFCPIVNIGF